MTLYDINPVAKPRMTRQDKWKKRPPVLKYWAFCQECKLKGVVLPTAGASVTFFVPMPKSWGSKKRAEMCGTPHLTTPDLSNFLKALEDSLYLNDSEIWNYKCLQKIWAVEGAIEITTK